MVGQKPLINKQKDSRRRCGPYVAVAWTVFAEDTRRIFELPVQLRFSNLVILRHFCDL